MKQTEVQIHPDFVVGEVSPAIFGGFIEHIGRCVYEGVYDPSSALADEDGFRIDVMAALRELEMTVVRYPGGNFVSGYHWRDGVGPKSERPTVQELAWQSLETNQFGTDEFLKLCRKMDWEPMIAVNLGTGTPEEARDWVEYCNSPAGTRIADQRVANGNDEGYAVKYWCLGNEMDGPWQLGHVPAQEYAIRAQQAAKMMKDCDPSIKMIVCGSCMPDLPTFLDWDRTVMEHVGTLAPYISLHRYAGNQGDDSQEYLGFGRSIDAQIEAVDACCKMVQAKSRRRKQPYLCFDEWNVWYRTQKPEFMNGRGQFAPHLNEENYNVEDALVVAQFMNSFIRHADIVKIANLAQVVNVIAPLMTRGDELFRQTIFHAFKLFSQNKQGVSLRLAIDGPEYQTEAYGQVPYLDCSAILNEEAQKLTLFAVNRSVNEVLPLKVVFSQIDISAISDVQVLTDSDIKMVNKFGQPDLVNPKPFDSVSIVDNCLKAELPVASLTRIVVSY